MAFGSSESDEFVNQVLMMAPELVPSSEGKPSVDALETISKSTTGLALLWELVINGQDLFLADTASLHGFGLADWDRKPGKRPIGPARKRTSSDALILRSPKKPMPLKGPEVILPLALIEPSQGQMGR